MKHGLPDSAVQKICGVLNRYPKIFQTIELSSDTVEISCRRKVTRIDFVDDAVAHPIVNRPRGLF